MLLPADFDIAEYVRKSTEAQQLPEKVDDPAVLARIIALLGRVAKCTLDESRLSPLGQKQ